MVVGGAIKATTKRRFTTMLLYYELRSPNFGDEFRLKWITSNTLDHLLCTHYDITLQDITFNYRTLIDAISDINQATLSSAGIGDINTEAFYANENGIY